SLKPLHKYRGASPRYRQNADAGAAVVHPQGRQAQVGYVQGGQARVEPRMAKGREKAKLERLRYQPVKENVNRYPEGYHVYNDEQNDYYERARDYYDDYVDRINNIKNSYEDENQYYDDHLDEDQYHEELDYGYGDGAANYEGNQDLEYYDDDVDDDGEEYYEHRKQPYTPQGRSVAANYGSGENNVSKRHLNDRAVDNRQNVARQTKARPPVQKLLKSRQNISNINRKIDLELPSNIYAPQKTNKSTK
ncbi:unnamed protein product, partial [Meganyctiphanes norvegica]